MQLILDSTEFCRDFWMNGTSFRVLQQFIQRKEATLLLPEVVLIEVPVIYSEELLREIGKVRSFNNRLLNHRLMVPDSDKELDLLVSEYRSFLKDRMTCLGVTVQPYSNISHQDIVEREMRGIRPFSRTENKKKGSYRDFLIWMAVLDAVRIAEGQVFFISGNTSDFADDTRKNLHEHLRDDLEANGIDTSAVFYFESIDEFVKQIALPKMKTVVKWTPLFGPGG